MSNFAKKAAIALFLTAAMMNYDPTKERGYHNVNGLFRVNPDEEYSVIADVGFGTTLTISQGNEYVELWGDFPENIADTVIEQIRKRKFNIDEFIDEYNAEYKLGKFIVSDSSPRNIFFLPENDKFA